MSTGAGLVFHLLKHFPSRTGDLYLKYSETLGLGRRKIGKFETIETSFLAFLNSSVTWESELEKIDCESWNIPAPSVCFVLFHSTYK